MKLGAFLLTVQTLTLKAEPFFTVKDKAKVIICLGRKKCVLKAGRAARHPPSNSKK